MEEWIDNPAVGLASLEQFLGMEKGSLWRFYSPDNSQESLGFKKKISPFLEKLNLLKHPTDPPMADETKEELEDIYSVDKLYVANALDRDVIDAWK